MEKLLSIITIARNDDYKGNFKNRLINSINYNSRIIYELGFSDIVEIIIVDWNSKVPLKNILELNDDARNMCRFITVPIEIAKKALKDKQTFNIPCSANVGLRRAAGKYAFIISADMIVPRYNYSSLISFLNGEIEVPFNLNNSIFFIPTKRLKNIHIEKDTTCKIFDQIIASRSSQLMDAGFKWPGTGSGNVSLMNMALWKEFKGYDENLSDWGWNDIELPLRVTQKYPSYNLDFLGISVIDFEEPMTNEDISRKVNKFKVPISMVTNNSNWGLGNYTLNKDLINIKKSLYKKGSKPQKNKIGRDEFFNEFYSQKVKDNCCKYLKKFDSLNITNWELTNILSWFCTYQNCNSFLQIGVDNYVFPIMLGENFPSTNIYLIESWLGKSFNPKDMSLRLTKNGFAGYLRYICGKEQTGIKRLSENFKNDKLIDLVIIDLSKLEDNVMENMVSLIPLLSNNSFILLSSNNKKKLDETVSGLSNSFKIFCSKSGKVILLVKRIEKKNKINNNQYNILNFGKPPIFRKKHYLYWKHFLKIWRYPDYFYIITQKLLFPYS